jgi:hypothetical protein
VRNRTLPGVQPWRYRTESHSKRPSNGRLGLGPAPQARCQRASRLDICQVARGRTGEDARTLTGTSRGPLSCRLLHTRDGRAQIDSSEDAPCQCRCSSESHRPRIPVRATSHIIPAPSGGCQLVPASVVDSAFAKCGHGAGGSGPLMSGQASVMLGFSVRLRRRGIRVSVRLKVGFHLLRVAVQWQWQWQCHCAASPAKFTRQPTLCFCALRSRQPYSP